MRISRFSLPFLGSVLILATILTAAPTIRWTPERVSVNVFPGGTRTTTVSFVPGEDTGTVRVSLVPELQAIATASPEVFASLRAGVTETVMLTVRPPLEASVGTIDGALLLRSGSRTLAKPLPIVVVLEDASPAVQQVETYLVETLGTLTPPPSDVHHLPEVVRIPDDVAANLRAGSDGALALRVGSLVFVGSFVPNATLRSAIFALLRELEIKGIGTSALRAALLNTDVHQEVIDTQGLAVVEGGVTFNPYWTGITYYNGYWVMLDAYSHIVLRTDQAAYLLNGNLIFPNGSLSTGSETAVHELLHAMIFWSGCFVPPLLNGASAEETLVTALSEAVYAKHRGDLATFQASQGSALRLGGGGCLALLGLEPPIAYIGRTASGQTDVYTLDPTTGAVEQLTDDPEFDFGVSWDPTRTEVAFGSERNGQRDIWAVRPDGSGLRQVNSDAVLDQEPAWSPDGTAIAFGHLVSGNQIWKMTPTGGGLALLADLDRCGRPRWFPSGSQIAFDAVTNPNPPFTRELFIMNADGTNKRQITTSGGLKFLGDVSPDGQRIVFAWRLPPDLEDIYVINVDGSGLQRLTADPALDFNPVWSPDGSEIAFVSSRNGNTHIFIMAADGTNLRQVGFSDEEGFFGIDW